MKGTRGKVSKIFVLLITLCVIAVCSISFSVFSMIPNKLKAFFYLHTDLICANQSNKLCLKQKKTGLSSCLPHLFKTTYSKSFSIRSF